MDVGRAHIKQPSLVIYSSMEIISYSNRNIPEMKTKHKENGFETNSIDSQCYWSCIRLTCLTPVNSGKSMMMLPP